MKNKKRHLPSPLDHIIDKYSATPDKDPEILDYSARPTKKAIALAQIELVKRGRRQARASSAT